MTIIHAKDTFAEKALDSSIALIEVTTAHGHLLDQLVGKDDVHDRGTESTHALRQWRVGGELFTKTVYAITDAAQQIVYAAIYVFKTPKTITGFADVPGNVGHILNARAQTRLHGDPTALIFYSITNIRGADGKPLKPGAGTMLINGLLQRGDLPRGAVLSTLSPLRTLAKSAERMEGETFSDEQRLALAFAHLSQVSNPVQKFHMGNGARIGDIKLRATVDDAAPDAVQGLNVMVNYHYPTDAQQRADNRERFAAIISGQAKPESLRALFDADVSDRIARLNGVADEMQRRLVVRGRALQA